MRNPLLLRVMPLKKLKTNIPPRHPPKAVVKRLRQFRNHLKIPQTIIYVPEAFVRSLPTQQETNVKRSNWMAEVREFYIEIKTSDVG